VGAFAVTEPDAGSDVSSMKTRAVRRNGDWVLNGQKIFITNGGIAGVHVVVASVEPELGTRGQASFVVPPGTRGIRQGKKERKMGIRASHTAEVLLEDCTIPLENVLGGMEKLEARLARAREGIHSRSSVALKTFELSRPIVGAQALGIARAAFEFALHYAKERKQFGRALIENQAIAFMLADMATEIEATRALIWRALWEGRNGGEFKKAEGSMAKLKAGEVAVKVTEQAIQICGGYGYIRDFPVEKWHRDAKIYTLFEGTSEIQRIVISRALARD
jgi:alkylation response protein AidB-like acyl-CoA dehydrogenase